MKRVRTRIAVVEVDTANLDSDGIATKLEDAVNEALERLQDHPSQDVRIVHPIVYTTVTRSVRRFEEANHRGTIDDDHDATVLATITYEIVKDWD